MSRPPQLLGSQAIHNSSGRSQTVQVNESKADVTLLWKDLMKEYRKLDDSVTMRLNRNNAQFRDRERLNHGSKGSDAQDEACLYFWKELVENWKGRTDIINYCVQVVDKVVDDRQKTVQGQEAGLDADRQLRAKLYADEVKRTQIHNELTVESIVQKRSLEAFKTRCKYFEPPRTDIDARRWWDAANISR